MVAVERRMSRPLLSRSMVSHGRGMVIHIPSSLLQRAKMPVAVYVQAQPTRRGESRVCVDRQQPGYSHFYAAPLQLSSGLRGDRVHGLTGADAFSSVHPPISPSRTKIRGIVSVNERLRRTEHEEQQTSTIETLMLQFSAYIRTFLLLLLAPTETSSMQFL